MAELQESIFGILKRLAYSVFLLGFFVIGFQIGLMYQQHYFETGDTFNEWMDMERSCLDKEVQEKIGEKPDVYTCNERVEDYKRLVFYTRLEVLLVFLIVLFDYLKKPEDHWATNMARWFKSIDLK